MPSGNRRNRQGGAPVLVSKDSRNKVYTRHFTFRKSFKMAADTPVSVTVQPNDALGLVQSNTIIDWFAEGKFSRCALNLVNMTTASDVNNVAIYSAPHSGSNFIPQNTGEMRRLSGLRTTSIGKYDFQITRLGSVLPKTQNNNAAQPLRWGNRWYQATDAGLPINHETFVIMTDRVCSLDFDIECTLQFRGAQ